VQELQLGNTNTGGRCGSEMFLCSSYPEAAQCDAGWVILYVWSGLVGGLMYYQQDVVLC